LAVLAEVQNIWFKEHGDWLHPRQSLQISDKTNYWLWECF